jgi:hypothetical protein
MTLSVPAFTRTTRLLSGVRSIVDLGARPARAGVAHLPEVVLLVPEVDLRFGHADRFPVLGRLVVARNPRFRVALEDGDVQPRLVELPDVGEQFPRPRDRFLLEVIAETPVAEHLEEGVVVGVLADVVEVVVLAAGADALLRVGDPLVGRLSVPRKYGLNWFIPALANSSVGSSCGTTGDDGTLTCAVLLAEEVDELLANLGRGRHGSLGMDWK